MGMSLVQFHDSISGGNGDDYLQGNQGNDVLSGVNGDDMLFGGTETIP